MSYKMFTEYTCDVCGRKERVPVNHDDPPIDWYVVDLVCRQVPASLKELNARIGKQYQLCELCGINSSITIKPQKIILEKLTREKN